MSKIPSPPLQMESWANYLGGCMFLLLHKKWSFPLRISSVIATKSVRNCGFGHIYWKNPWWKTSFFVQHPFQKKLYIFSISFFIYFETVYIWPMYHTLDKRISFRIIFYLSKWVLLCSRHGFFYYVFNYFVPIAVFEDRVTKTDSKCFNRTFWPFFWSILFLYAPAHYAWLFKSLSSS